MKTVLTGLIVVSLLCLTGCWTTLGEIRDLKVDDHFIEMRVNASFETTKKAARAALIKATCTIKEESQVNAETYVLIGVTGMKLTHQGVWCKVWVHKLPNGKSSIHKDFRRRDPRAQYTPTEQVERNFINYFKAYIEEFALDEITPSKP